MAAEETESRFSLAILLGLFLLLAGWNAFVVLKDDGAPSPDEAGHYCESLGVFLGQRALFTPSSRPPLASLPAVPWYWVFGASQTVAQLSQLVFLLWFMLATYGLGRRLYGEACGRLAGVLAGLFPLTLGMSRVYTADLPCAAVIIHGLLCCLRASESSGTLRLAALPQGAAWELLKGALLLAISTYLRVAAVLYWFFPVIWLSWKFLRGARARAEVLSRIGQLCLAAALGLAVIGSHYLPSARFVWQEYAAPGPFLDPTVARHVSLLRNVEWFPIAASFAMGPLYSIVFIAALVVAAKVRRFSGLSFPLFWLLSGLGLLALLPYNHHRYLLPLTPAVALISSSVLWATRRSRVQYMGMGALIGAGVLQIVSLDLVPPQRQPEVRDPWENAWVQSQQRIEAGLYSFSKRPWSDEDLKRFWQEIVGLGKQGSPSSHLTREPIAILWTRSDSDPLRLELYRSAIEHSIPVRFTSLWEVAYPFGEPREETNQTVLEKVYALASSRGETRQSRVDAEAFTAQRVEVAWRNLERQFIHVGKLAIGPHVELEVFEATVRRSELVERVRKAFEQLPPAEPRERHSPR